jgi:hypothetical protein
MLLALVLACGGSEPPEPPPAKVEAPPAPVVTIDPARLAGFAPLPARMDVGEAPPAALVDLGRMLVQKMGRHQLGKELTPEQVREIEAWLGALEGTPPAEYIKEPALPGLAAATSG